MFMYDPTSTMSVPMFCRIRLSVSVAKLSASDSVSSIFMRATFSPGMARMLSPALNSVVNISASAVDNQAASARPDRFLKPSTATDRRILVEEPAEGATDGVERSQSRAPHPNPSTTAATTAAAAHVHLLRPGRRETALVPGVAPRRRLGEAASLTASAATRLMSARISSRSW
jgi:hypothetical protein